MDKTKVLIITADSIGPVMAGPAIRAVSLGKSLQLDHEVTVVTTGDFIDFESEVPVCKVTKRVLKQFAKNADVIIFQGFVLSQNPWMKKVDAILVADLYDPLHLEHLEDTQQNEVSARNAEIRNTVAVITEQLRFADFVICASEKQRDFWLGYLSALGRINPQNYSTDSTLRDLIDVVPFGTSDENPQQNYSGLRGKVPGINQEDFIFIWGGGIYNWFDPLTLIKAVKKISVTHPQLRLFFMGLTHPNPQFSQSSMSENAVELATSLGLINKFVFFNHAWVPFEERANFLLDANVGVSTHFVHLETAYSFRTRILDYLWAGLPIVTTEGDTFAQIVDHNKLGVVVDELDVDSCVAALIRMIDDPDFYESCIRNVSKIREQFKWSNAAAPLVNFVARAEKAPDRSRPISSIPLKIHREIWLTGKVRGAKLALDEGGIKLVFRKFFRVNEGS